MNKHPSFIGIIHGCGGWNSCCFTWEQFDSKHGGYTPVQTGFNNTSLGTGTVEGAIEEAVNWAENEEMPIRLYVGTTSYPFTKDELKLVDGICDRARIRYKKEGYND